MKAHAALVDHDQAHRLRRHASGQAFGDETVAGGPAEARLRDRYDGSVAIDDRRTKQGRGVRFLADCFGELGKLRNIFWGSFRFGVRQSPHPPAS
jgi:hypothetical protein